ncbi:hypothetical protein [Cupriavidus sp. SS-3]|uniref:hypothetical protein n=1 Tax=Cupriavidus sp. SS-3 TaxID=3109596 RepID=UPI002DB9D841|nr:hypothetical protein [Cupriavidus sp. SS-3]MEC3766872.1 hypothetical protein [Cupriavidus sp. SS-3]
MPGLLFKLTSAGRAALVNPENTGTVSRQVVSVGIATAPFAHNDGLTALPNERAPRLTTVAGDTVADDTIHVTMTDNSADQYTMYGFGLYLDNGVLLGTYGQDTPILEKSPAAMMLLATDILLTTVEAAALTFGNTSFLNPPATTTVKGVVELADNTETQTGTDATRSVTPAGLSSRTATDTRTGLVELATNSETQAGTDATRSVTPAGLSSRTATETRTGLLEIATQTEVDQGTDDARAVTAKKLLARLKLLGFGGVGTEGAITDMDDATVPGGLLYVPGAAINVPLNLGPGVALHRPYGTAGFQLFSPYSSDRIVFRRRTSNAWQAWKELALLDSPTFVGTPLVPTAAKGTTTKQAASTEFVMAAIADLVASSPGTLDTLKELAEALGNDPNFATTVTTQLGNKFDKAGGVIGLQTSGWPAINAPTARIIDGGNTQAANGPSGGLAIESYGPGVQLIDRSAGARNARLMADGSILSVSFDTTAAPGSYAYQFLFSADGYMAVGGPLSSAAAIRMGLPIPGGAVSQHGIYNNVEFNETATSTGATYSSIPRVKDAAFTMANLVGFFAPTPVVGDSATVTEYAGLMANDVTLPNILRKIGARLRMGAGPDKWNLYGDGTASNHLAGKLLLGTTADNGNLLQVAGSASIATRLYRGLDADLAVGATSIAGIQNAATGNDSYINTARFSNDTQPAGINIGKSRGVTVTTQGAVLSGDPLGHVNFCGSDGVGMNVAAQVEVVASENYTTTARGAHMDFRTTAPGTTARAVKMRLADNGELRIGNTATDGSGAKLQVTGYATADTPPAGDSSRKLATTAWVMSTLLTASVGQIIIEPRTTARAGCLKLNGALLKRADYPELWAYAQASGAIVTDAAWLAGSWGCFSHGDGNTTFRIPEYRGEYLRFWDDARGADAGRGIGVFQDSQNKTHSHAASATPVGDHNHGAWTDAQGWHGHGVNDPGHAHSFQTWTGGGATGAGRVSGSYVTNADAWAGTSASYTGISIAGDGSHAHNVGVGYAGNHSHTITVNADGGAEVRVRNISALAMIRAF